MLKMIYAYWPLIVFFIIVISFFRRNNNYATECVKKLKSYSKKEDEIGKKYFKKLLSKRNEKNFIFFLIAGITLSIFFFRGAREIFIKYFSIYCIVLCLGYLFVCFNSIKYKIKLKKADLYTVDMNEVKTKILYTNISSNHDDIGSASKKIFYTFSFENSDDFYNASKGILLFNETNDYFQLLKNKECIGKCYILDNKLFVEIKNDV